MHSQFPGETFVKNWLKANDSRLYKLQKNDFYRQLNLNLQQPAPLQLHLAYIIRKMNNLFCVALVK